MYMNVRAVSSVGRAARLHRVGREFETLTAHHLQEEKHAGKSQSYFSRIRR